MAVPWIDMAIPARSIAPIVVFASELIGYLKHSLHVVVFGVKRAHLDMLLISLGHKTVIYLVRPMKQSTFIKS
jgi:hypothetical protein